MLGGIQVSREDIDKLDIDTSDSDSDNEAPVVPRMIMPPRPLSMPSNAFSLNVPRPHFTPTTGPLSARLTPTLLARQVSFLDSQTRSPIVSNNYHVSFGRCQQPISSPQASDDEMESYCLVSPFSISLSECKIPPPPPLMTPPPLITSEPHSPPSPHKTRRSSSIWSGTFPLLSHPLGSARSLRRRSCIPLQSTTPTAARRASRIRRTSITLMQRSLTSHGVVGIPTSP
eukprot:c8620_g1_i1.p1 GENE.c8620_g1_i1~~c8620_g1_i1.p1  ORF type:complete len:229 (-),score=21.37 c8620_g1_i1:187-873(-)